MRRVSLGFLLLSSMLPACSCQSRKPAPASIASASASSTVVTASPSVSAAIQAVKARTVEPSAPGASLPQHPLTLKAGYPTVDALERYRLLQVESTVPSLTDGDLLTAWTCSEANTSPCRVEMKLTEPAHLSFLRVFVGSATAPSKTVANANQAKLRLVVGELIRDFDIKATGEFLHLPLDVELPPGTITLELIAQGQQPAPALSEIAFFGVAGPIKTANWRADSMVVRAQSHFWTSQPNGGANSATIGVDELDQTLTPHRRLRASEVIAIPSTPYAIVRRTPQVSCPGAVHYYQTQYFLLDTRSSLLAYWHQSALGQLSFDEKRRELRNASYDAAKGDNVVYSVTLTATGLKNPNSNVPRVVQPDEAVQGKSWLDLGQPREPKCHPATAEDVQRLTVATARTEPLAPEYIVRCELSERLHLLVDNTSCQYEPQGNAAVVVDAKSGTLVGKLSGSFYAYRARRIAGRWFLGAEEDDSSQLFYILPNGTFKRLWANAGFAVGEASTCRCSA